LAEQLNGGATAGDAQLAPRAGEVRLHSGGGEAEAFRDLAGLKMVRDAFQATPLLPCEPGGEDPVDFVSHKRTRSERDRARRGAAPGGGRGVWSDTPKEAVCDVEKQLLLVLGQGDGRSPDLLDESRRFRAAVALARHERREAAAQPGGYRGQGGGGDPVGAGLVFLDLLIGHADPGGQVGLAPAEVVAARANGGADQDIEGAGGRRRSGHGSAGRGLMKSI